MKDFIVKPVLSTEKVLPMNEPSDLALDRPLTVCRNETISYQIAYYWSRQDVKRIHIEVQSPLKELLHIRQVKNVPCLYPCHAERDEDYLVSEPGLYPDLLSEISTFGIYPLRNQWGSIWISLEVPEGIPAQEYPVHIRFLCEGELLETATVHCTVLDAVLPPLPIPHTEWFHSDCLADYYHVEVFSEEYWRITENFIRTAAKHNCNMILTPVFTPPLDTAIGGERRTVQLVEVEACENGWHFDFSRLKRWVALCRDCGIRYFEISHLFSQWGAVSSPKIMARQDGVLTQVFGWDTKADSKDYRFFLQSFLSELKVVIYELGIEKSVYFHISDEPTEKQLPSYQAAKEIVAEALEEFEIIDALSHFEFYENGLVKQPVCATNCIEPFLANRPEKLWAYYCTSQGTDVSNRFIAMPGGRTRILGQQLYKYHIDGFLHWGYNFYNCQFSLYPVNPYSTTDSDGAFPSGDPFLVYPGADGRPEESIRFMLMDEAMNDLRALYLLESMIGREKVLSLIEADNITFSHYPRTPSYCADMRQRINDAIQTAAPVA